MDLTMMMSELADSGITVYGESAVAGQARRRKGRPWSHANKQQSVRIFGLLFPVHTIHNNAGLVIKEANEASSVYR
jgi:hypothetical protein